MVTLDSAVTPERCRTQALYVNEGALGGDATQHLVGGWVGASAAEVSPTLRSFLTAGAPLNSRAAHAAYPGCSPVLNLLLP